MNKAIKKNVLIDDKGLADYMIEYNVSAGESV